MFRFEMPRPWCFLSFLAIIPVRSPAGLAAKISKARSPIDLDCCGRPEPDGPPPLIAARATSISLNSTLSGLISPMISSRRASRSWTTLDMCGVLAHTHTHGQVVCGGWGVGLEHHPNLCQGDNPVHICDREGDIWELFCLARELDTHFPLPRPALFRQARRRRLPYGGIDHGRGEGPGAAPGRCP